MRESHPSGASLENRWVLGLLGVSSLLISLLLTAPEKLVQRCLFVFARLFVFPGLPHSSQAPAD